MKIGDFAAHRKLVNAGGPGSGPHPGGGFGKQGGDEAARYEKLKNNVIKPTGAAPAAEATLREAARNASVFANYHPGNQPDASKEDKTAAIKAHSTAYDKHASAEAYEDARGNIRGANAHVLAANDHHAAMARIRKSK